MEDVDDLAGEALQLVVEVMGKVIDALVGALDPAAHLGEMLGLLVAELVELGPELAQQFFEFLLKDGRRLKWSMTLRKTRRIAASAAASINHEERCSASGEGTSSESKK